MLAVARRFEVISPAFVGGADGAGQAELLRGSAYRGLLRWWLRTLDGFAESRLPALEQELAIFGAIAPKPVRGALTVRPASFDGSAMFNRAPIGLEKFNATMPNAPLSYLFFPLRSDARAAIFNSRFELRLGILPHAVKKLWSGDQQAARDDLDALLVVLGHIGSIGFRSRRGAGALKHLAEPQPELSSALDRFRASSEIDVRVCQGSLICWEDAVVALEEWYKQWRTHRQGFGKQDHDIPLGSYSGPVSRPTLGMPIMTRPERGHWLPFESDRGKGTGRFASPLILRPHFDGQEWRALAIFVERHRWPDEIDVGLERNDRIISRHKTDPALWDAMKKSLPTKFMGPAVEPE